MRETEKKNRRRYRLKGGCVCVFVCVGMRASDGVIIVCLFTCIYIYTYIDSCMPVCLCATLNRNAKMPISILCWPRISDTDISFFGVIHQTSRINSTHTHTPDTHTHIHTVTHLYINIHTAC